LTSKWFKLKRKTVLVIPTESCNCRDTAVLVATRIVLSSSSSSSSSSDDDDDDDDDASQSYYIESLLYTKDKLPTSYDQNRRKTTGRP